MTWFADGSPCTYFGWFERSGERLVQIREGIVAIGWLDGSHEYERGRVEQEVDTKLREIVRSAWQPVGFCGSYVCELPPCREMRRAAGVYNLFVPADGCA